VGAADVAPQPPASLLPDEEKPAQPLSITAGRPNVPALLDFVASQGAAEREIGVIAAGGQRSQIWLFVRMSSWRWNPQHVSLTLRSLLLVDAV
jgi:hypothetical protein